MNFIIQSKALLQQLQIVGGVVAGNSNLPILNDFLFDIKNGELTIYGSDLETTISSKIPVQANEDGKIAIQAKLLTDTLKTFPDQPLTFTVHPENHSVTVTSETGKYKVAGHDPAEFPSIPEFEGGASVTMDSSVLAQAIHKTIFATSNDEMRPVMMGVYFELGPDGVNFVATDAHKLVKYSRTDITSSEVRSIILPKKPLNLLKGILLGFDTPVTLVFNEKNLIFRFDNITVQSRLIEGKYPNYESVIPKNNPNQLIVDKNQFLTTLRRVSIFANKTTYQVRLKMTGSELQISAEDLDFANEAYERIVCNYSGTDMEIGFNSKFLNEMLSNLDSENVVMDLSESTRAGILRPSEVPDENEKLMMLVMPIMLNT